MKFFFRNAEGENGTFPRSCTRDAPDIWYRSDIRQNPTFPLRLSGPDNKAWSGRITGFFEKKKKQYNLRNILYSDLTLMNFKILSAFRPKWQIVFFWKSLFSLDISKSTMWIAGKFYRTSVYHYEAFTRKIWQLSTL